MSLFICTGNSGKIREIYSFFKEENLHNLHLLGIKDLENKYNIIYEEPEENFEYFLLNAFLKLQTATRYLAKNNIVDNISHIIVDDSGLCLSELNNEPGVHSAYYGGLPRSDKKNRDYLKKKIYNYKQESAITDIRLNAFFVCCILSLEFTEAVKTYFATNNFNVRDFNQNYLINKEKEIFELITNVSLTDSYGQFHNIKLKLSDNIMVSAHIGYCFGKISTIEQQLIINEGHGYDSMFFPRQNKNYSFASISLEQKNKWSHRALALKSFSQDFFIGR